MNTNELKKLAAEKAVEEIKTGMIIGLGSGSTFQFAIEKISQKIKSGELKNIFGIPSSSMTEKEAVRLEVPLTSFENLLTNRNQLENQNNEAKTFSIDLTIDGADEVDENLNLIKGGGGAMLREKIIAQESKRILIMIDETKLSKYLGTKFFVPVEVIPFALSAEKKYLENIGAKVSIRKNPDGSNYITDEKNYILDANFGQIKNVIKLADVLNKRAGIVEHGLFVGMQPTIICAKKNGIEIIKPPK
jgi:ribose 5-phosphate isomerase A